MTLESLDPALHGASILAEKFRYLLTALPASDQQQAVQPVVVTRLIGAGDLLLDGNSHDFGIDDFQLSHDDTSEAGKGHQYNSIMRHYICR